MWQNIQKKRKTGDSFDELTRYMIQFKSVIIMNDYY